MEKVKLGDACVFIRNGANIKNDKGKSGIPITRIETIANGVIDEDSLGYANIYDEKYEDYYLKQNDILMSHINSMKHLGKVAICNEDKKIIHGMNLLNIRLKENILAKYVYYFFKTDSFRKQLHKISKQSVNQSSFNVNDFKKISIDLPDFRTQNKVADIMDKVEEIIDIRKKQIEQLDELVKSQFVEMFKNSKKIKLCEMANITMGQSPDSSSYNDNGEGVPFFQGKADYGEKYTVIRQWTSKPSKLANNGDVLMSVRAPVGPVNISSCDCCIGRGLCAISAKDGVTNNEFIYNSLNAIQDEISLMGAGSTFKAITKNDVFNIEIPFASIELQNKFAEFVKQIDKQKFEIQKSLEETQKLQESLMNKYFG